MPRKRKPALQPPPAAMPAVVWPVRGDPRVTVTFSEAHTHRGVAFGKGETYAATQAELDLFAHFSVLEDG